MKTYLITGGAGFIGSSFVAQTVAAGNRAVVLDVLTYAGHRENLAGVPASPSPFPGEGWGGGYTLIVGDICNAALVADILATHQPDAIIHFAAESHVDNSITGSAAFIQTNIVGAHVLLEAARVYYDGLTDEKRDTFRYVQVSTDEVYGALGATGHFTETSPMRPNSPYSASKAGADLLARAWFQTYGLPVITTHCSNNYGPRQYPEKLIPLMISRAISGGALPVYGDGKNIRDWIHVEDHCAGVALALTRGKPGETYCFGGRAEIANIDMVHSICDILDGLRPRAGGGSYRDQIQFVTDRLGHDFRYAIDDAKSERELGFTRRYKVQDGLRQTVEWYLNNAAWIQAVTKGKAT